MPPLSAKTLSPAELQKLEHAFAADPASEAYRPLAEAYLAMGRYMEAMVVCKKGVKAHPSLPDPRVLLARVYADQGKDKKALEELAGALQVAPNDKAALRLSASIQLKSGDASGKVSLLKAFELDPADAETLAAMQQFKVEAPRKETPPPPPPPSVPAQPSAQTHGGNGSAGGAQVSVQAPRAIPGTVPQTSRAGGAPVARARPAAPPPRREPREPTSASGFNEVPSELSEFHDGRGRRHKKGGVSRALFFLLIISVPSVGVAYYGITNYRARQARAVKQLVQQAGELIKRDTYDSYREACDKANKALNEDASSELAHSYLAYAYTVRWAEHEHDDKLRELADEHLKEAARDKDISPSFYFAATALRNYYGAKTSAERATAQKTLEERVKGFEAENRRSSLLNLTLGILQMNSGDLERAKESLEKAQAIAPDDPRVYVALGNLNRRRGSDQVAERNFDNALRYSINRSHPDAIIGVAILALDLENPGIRYVVAANNLKVLLTANPPPSPRQLAQAHFARALLISRVSTDLPLYTDVSFQKKLSEGTGVTADAAKARKEVQTEEGEGESLDRLNPDLNIIRAKRLFWETKYDEAVAEVQKAIDANPSMAHYHVELAKIWLKRQGGDANAEQALRKALSLVPNSPRLLALLGGALYRQKKVEEARETLEKAVGDPKTKNPEARFVLGTLYRDDKKDYEKAAVNLERAAQEYFADPSMAAQAYDELAYTYELKSDKDKAKSSYEKALNAADDFAPPYCHYARFLAKFGDSKDKERIKLMAERSLKLEPRGECADDMKRFSGG